MGEFANEIARYFNLKRIEISNENKKIIDNQIAIIEEMLPLAAEGFNTITTEIPSVIELAYVQGKCFTEINKKNNGIYFTPVEIAIRMARLLISHWGRENIPKIIDPAMGSGVLLLAVVSELVNHYKISYKEAIENYICGVDICRENFELTKLFLWILCLEKENCIPNVNIFQKNSLDFTEEEVRNHFDKSFDCIISNPPYVSSKNMDKNTKEKVYKFNKSRHGNSDLYISFFEIAINLLSPNGIGVYITPNSYFRSLNGKKLRQFLRDNTSWIKLINFDSYQVFDDALHYAAITIFQKSNEEFNSRIFYLAAEHSRWIQIFPEDYWITISDVEQKLIFKLESAFKWKVDDMDFKNGIATQRNSIYMIQPVKEDKEYYYFWHNDYEEKIEKNITRPFVLPNVLNKKNMRIIYPYIFKQEEDVVEPISPIEMELKYPYAYKYLLSYKAELEKRKHDKNMEFWYLYGRKQGLKQYGKRLYLPYMAKNINTSISVDEDEVFAAGYAIFHESELYLRYIGKILESRLFSFYLKKVSKPYEGGYYSTAKNMIKRFAIPKETEATIQLHSNEDIYKLYGLNSEEIELINSLK